MKKPDFICIGPTKTGTTWLFEMLSAHPQVWLPPFKEIRYFNEGNVVPAHSLLNVLFNPHWHYRIMRRNLFRNFRELGSAGNWKKSRYENPWWFFRYSFGHRSPAWYSGLFLPDPDQRAGDISPNYYEMPAGKVRQLAAYKPDIQVILFIRDPIERVWSLATMVLLKDRRRRIDQVSQAEFIAYFDRVYTQWRSYREAVRLWRACFPDVFVGLYRELNRDPALFFRHITDFLGVDHGKVPAAILARRPNAGMGQPIPPELHAYLENQYAGEIQELAGGML